MNIAQIIILLATGMGVGFISGLIGVGGAFIMTPVQYIVYTAMGISSDVAIKLAFGTSLFVILPTAISGILRHSREGAVWWKAAIIMGICSLLFAYGGASLATHLPGTTLKITFGVIALASGIRMLITRLPQVEPDPKDKAWLLFVWAIPIGLTTGILGIGGGVLTVPILAMAIRTSMHRAVATSLAVMIFGSIGGIIGYLINGLGVPGLPDYSIGYIHLPTWAMLAITSIGMAQLGAITAHRLPAHQLRYIFVVILFFMGLRMLGVFE